MEGHEVEHKNSLTDANSSQTSKSEEIGKQTSLLVSAHIISVNMLSKISHFIGTHNSYRSPSHTIGFTYIYQYF